MAYDKSVPFSFTKNGIYYFERRVPADLLKHYDTRKIAYSLRTRSAKVAGVRARRAADKLDEHWYYLRSMDAALPGRHRLQEAVVFGVLLQWWNLIIRQDEATGSAMVSTIGEDQ